MCQFDECHFAACHFYSCHFSECHFAECHLRNVLMLTVIMNSQDKFPVWMNSNPGKKDYSANSKNAMASLKRYDKQINILE